MVLTVAAILAFRLSPQCRSQLSLIYMSPRGRSGVRRTLENHVFPKRRPCRVRSLSRAVVCAKRYFSHGQISPKRGMRRAQPRRRTKADHGVNWIGVGHEPFHVQRLLTATILLFGLVAVGSPQEEPLCVEDSPERRGETGAASSQGYPCRQISGSLPSGILSCLITKHPLNPLSAPQALLSRPMVPGGLCQSDQRLTIIIPANMSLRSTCHHSRKRPHIRCALLSAYIPAGMTSRVHFHLWSGGDSHGRW